MSGVKSAVAGIGFKDEFGEQLTVPASNGTKTVFNRYRGYNGIVYKFAAAGRLGLVPRIGALYKRSATGVWTNMMPSNTSSQTFMPPPTTANGVFGISCVDRGTTNTALANFLVTDQWYVGFVNPVNDMFVDVGSTVNAVASTLTCENSTDGSGQGGFVALSIVDGTISGSATLATNGNITFTPPATWAAIDLTRIFTREVGGNGIPGAPSGSFYYLRFSFSASLTAGTNLDQVAGFVYTDGGGTTTGQQGFRDAGIWYTQMLDPEVGAVQLMSQSTSATTCDFNWVRLGQGAA